MARLPEHLTKVAVGRQRLSREALSKHQRDRMLQGATGVFAKRGYQATTIDNIVVASKASVGSFYQLFDGKEDCFLGVYDAILAAAKERIAAAVSPADGWVEQTYLGLRELLEILVADPLAARIALLEVQTAGEVATARYNATTDAVVEWLRRGRASHPGSAQLPDSFEQAAVAGFAFFLQQRLLASAPLAVDALMSDTVQMVLEPITGVVELRRVQDELASAQIV